MTQKTLTYDDLDITLEDIYEAISLKTCVEKRNTIGAPGPDAMSEVIAINESFLKDK